MASILLVDDNNELRAVLAEVLADAGHTVAEASDGRSAISLLRTNAYAVVITDVLMPEADGAEVLTMLRGQNPRPKVVVMSGGGQIDPERYLQTARLLGADAVLRKPFLPSLLISTLKTLLGG